MKRTLFLNIALLLAMGLYAYDFKYGDLYYNITSDSTVEVTYENHPYWPGPIENYDSLTSVIIPETVIHNSTTYNVTRIGGGAFWNCENITSVSISNSVKEIEGSMPVYTANGIPMGYIGAFSNCSNLRKITIPNSLTDIGDRAFSGCTNLTSVTGCNGVRYIGKYAFADTPWLDEMPDGVLYIGKVLYTYRGTMPEKTSITIRDSIVFVEESAFLDCTGLASITIPYSVTRIGWDAFNGCTGLTEVNYIGDVKGWLDIDMEGYWYEDKGSNPLHYAKDIYLNNVLLTELVIPEGTTNISSNFSGCTSIASVTIPNSVTSIGFSVFSGCTGLTSITIPDGVTGIGGSAFKGCTGLTSVTIPNSVTSIGGSAFEGCTGLTSVTIPNSVTSIGGSAFKGCTGLTSVTIPNSVTSIGGGAFSNTGLTSIAWNVKSYESLFYDDAYYEDYRYDSDKDPFYGIRSQIKSFTFGDSVVAIPAYMCYEMDSLTSISFGKSITKIGTFALQGCNNLQNVYWNVAADSVASPFCYYFHGNFDLRPQITSFTFGNDVKSIPDAFCSKMRLTTISIPDNVTHIGDGAFKECGKLSSVTIGKNVKRIDSEAFRGCDSLKSVHFQGTLSDWANIDFEGYDIQPNCYGCDEHKGANPLEYADSLFIDNSYVTDITIPEGVTAIKRCAFFGYAGLQSLKLPNSLKEIGDGAFYGCTSLTSTLSLPNVTSIGQWAFHSTGIHGTLNIPHSVTSLGDAAFRYCAGIDTLIIGNGIADINNQFIGCDGITYLQLGSGVKTLGSWAFDDSEKLKRIVCYAIEPPASRKGSFYNYNIHVQVPCDNLEDYETDAVWGSFKYLECVGAEKTETNGKVLVTPRDNDADITWPTNSNAETYTILITQDGTEICTLIFNADGQLTRIAFSAPSRNGEQRRTPAALLTQDGYRFTVTGLSSATQYAYAIDVKDAKSNVLNTYKGSFTTTGVVTGFEETPATDETLGSDAPRKVFRDGQVYILRGGKTYTLTGVEVK